MKELILNTRNIFDIVAIFYDCIFSDIHANTEYSELISRIFKNSYINYLNEGDIIAFNKLKENILFEIDKSQFKYTDYFTFIILVDDFFKCHTILREEKKLSLIRPLNENYLSLNIYIYANSENSFMNNFNREGLSFFRNEIISNKNKPLSLKNITVMRKEDIGSFDLNVYFYDDHKYFDQCLNSSAGLEYSISPFKFFDIFTLLKTGLKEKEIRFEGTYIEKEEEHTIRYMQILENMLKNDSQFIVFPELIVTEKVLLVIKEFIRSQKLTNLKIIVLGTQSLNGVNKLFVLDSKGNELFTQTKKFAFEHNGVMEYLKLDNIVNVLEIFGLGRILFLICADINFVNYDMLISYFKIDMIILISFSPSLDILSKCKTLSANSNIVCVMANACSAIYIKDKNLEQLIAKKSTIGSIVTPAIQLTERESFRHDYIFNDGCRDCEKTCKVRTFSIYPEIVKNEIKSTIRVEFKN